MSAKRSPKPGRRAAGRPSAWMAPPRRVRKIPRLPDEPVNMTELIKAVGWVEGLLMKRYEQSIPKLADLAHLAVQTVRDYVQLKHPGAWFTSGTLAQALGRYPEDVVRLARRWLAKYRRRETARHRHERGWELRFPWDPPPEESKHE